MTDLAGAGAAASTFSERWAAPATPNAADEEFTSGYSNFTLYSAAGAVVASQPVDDVINPYANDTTNHHIDCNVKRSWLRWKCPNNNTRYYLLKSKTLATNELSWTRVGVKSRPPGVGANDEVDIGLILMGASAGLPDPNNRLEFRLINLGSSGRKFIAWSVAGGALTEVWNAAAGTAPEEETIPGYLNLHKLSGTYHFWLGQNESAMHGHIGSIANALTVAYVGYVGICNAGTPGSGWCETDFLRFLETDKFIP